METLEKSSWDVVISGTGLPQSLLALALSRSGKKILHIDRNEYYGGDEAALSLQEAEEWCAKHKPSPADTSTVFGNAVTRKLLAKDKLKASRAYSLALAPQLLYCRSELLSAVVASQTHTQLDFQAVASWFIVNAPPDGSASQARLTRVPGGREDIFQDASLDLKAKRALMKFLRFVADYEQQLEIWDTVRSLPFTSFLEQKFGLPSAYHPPILALALSAQSSDSTTVEFALPRISRHLRSIGVFGPGFPAVLPKWGGLAEVGQVACRAGAVGGGVYVLGKGLKEVQSTDSGLRLELTGGEKITSRWLVGTSSELCSAAIPAQQDSATVPVMLRSISIISSPLPSLFPPTSEGGVSPVGAVVLVPSANNDEPPVHIFAHSGDSGECPADQCVLYGYVSQTSDVGIPRLRQGVDTLLDSIGDLQNLQVVWSMHWEQHYPPKAQTSDEDHIIALQSLSPDLAFDDDVLADVKSAWQRIAQPEDPEGFMKFEARDGTTDEDDE
ncbi:Rab proteins geranylgeranyltransferase component A [Pseudocercospora fuligena]|uniref:Rab proteins geranylgeranyltransferase n=1 Tax=Pseudocercospora fuligena TaxID=685502 RepID=A0A8H6VGF8_9PEZI|nr:Rab proteins geranylgeranyltransferase component A [Pseudocercospora fuligena]